jgi:hypothetical protein
MKFWTDKQGNKLTLKQFLIRWKQGMNKTPLMKKLNDVEGILDEDEKRN